MIGQKLSKELHAQLLSEQKRFDHEIELLSAGGVRSDTFQDDETDAVDQHPADDASELLEREKNLAVRRTLEASLGEVREALRKFDEGTYGLCESCGRAVAEKRLRALPFATHCIDCQCKLERQAQALSR
jgi:RNA polymerase-binding transcription factor DksA